MGITDLDHLGHVSKTLQIVRANQILEPEVSNVYWINFRMLSTAAYSPDTFIRNEAKLYCTILFTNLQLHAYYNQQFHAIVISIIINVAHNKENNIITRHTCKTRKNNTRVNQTCERLETNISLTECDNE